jgi:hypothetical protein
MNKTYMLFSGSGKQKVKTLDDTQEGKEFQFI